MAEDEDEYDPGAQLTQLDDDVPPDAELDVPAGQLVQVTDDSSENHPALHEMHDPCATLDW